MEIGRRLRIYRQESDSEDDVGFASDIPADRLIHIMRLGREMGQVEWDILDAHISGQSIRTIGDSLDISKSTVWDKLQNIIEKIGRSVLLVEGGTHIDSESDNPQPSKKKE